VLAVSLFFAMANWWDSEQWKKQSGSIGYSYMCGESNWTAMW